MEENRTDLYFETIDQQHEIGQQQQNLLIQVIKGIIKGIIIGVAQGSLIIFFITVGISVVAKGMFNNFLNGLEIVIYDTTSTELDFNGDGNRRTTSYIPSASYPESQYYYENQRYDVDGF